jgi:hypothetical protein
MQRRISCCSEEEDSEREVQTHHHGVARVRMCRILKSPDRRIKGARKQQAYQNQDDFQCSFSKHFELLNLGERRVSDGSATGLKEIRPA